MSLTITKDEVIAIAPELGQNPKITDDVWDLFLGFAADEVGSEIPDQSSKDRCGRYITAHLVTTWARSAAGMSPTGSPAGPLSQVTVGPVSKTFAVPKAYLEAAMTDAVLLTTTYGREFLRLIRLYMGGSFMVSGGLGPVGGLPGSGWGW